MNEADFKKLLKTSEGQKSRDPNNSDSVGINYDLISPRLTKKKQISYADSSAAHQDLRNRHFQSEIQTTEPKAGPYHQFDPFSRTMQLLSRKAGNSMTINQRRKPKKQDATLKQGELNYSIDTRNREYLKSKVKSRYPDQEVESNAKDQSKS